MTEEKTRISLSILIISLAPSLAGGWTTDAFAQEKSSVQDGGGSFRADGGVVADSRGGVAVCKPGGEYVVAFPDGAKLVLIKAQSYYVAGGVYYQPCYVCADVNYCMVEAPSNNKNKEWADPDDEWK
jgi:hypothetical protein